MSPPGGAPTASARWDHKQRETSADDARPDMESALRLAQTYCWNVGARLSHSKLRRLVHAWLADSATHRTFGEWVIAYSDPTGEAAVRNVMAELRRAARA